MKKILMLITVTLITGQVFANDNCTETIENLKELRKEFISFKRSMSSFNGKLDTELSGTYGVLRGWEGKKLYIRHGGFDTFKTFVNQVEGKHIEFEDQLENKVESLNELIFDLGSCLNE